MPGTHRPQMGGLHLDLVAAFSASRSKMTSTFLSAVSAASNEPRHRRVVNAKLKQSVFICGEKDSVSTGDDG